MTPRSFLPQIVGLFYAHFDATLGPVVQHQVPENLITSRATIDSDTRSRSRSKSRSRSRARSRAPASALTCSASASASASTSTGSGRGRQLSPPYPYPNHSSNSRSSSISSTGKSGGALLNFGLISEYVIPKKSLHGRLVTLLTTGVDEDERKEYRVMGYPNVMTGEGGQYKRNEYMWNLCFVFHASSSLEAFEPVVRKCARILRSAERDSSYLSASKPEHTPFPAVLEQLFEDLNSYSETSIPLDGFNSLELKLFPFYPNPPECEDWHVPIALVDLNALKDDNWDITAARVSQHIDGIHHVKKIAELADADEALTRETLKHMLYYQVVMMIDIFQYSNMYTLKPAISRLGSDETIIDECPPYVTRPGFPHPEWPVLLRLYSKLSPGITIHDWIETNEVLSLGIDPRRFVSFGIIKGFLRRVHRWPKMIERTSSPLIPLPVDTRRRVGFDESTRIGSSTTLNTRDNRSHGGDSGLSRPGPGESNFTLRSVGSNASLGVSPTSRHLNTPPSAMDRSPRRRNLPFSQHSGDKPSSSTATTPGPFARSQASLTESHPSLSSRRAVGPISISNYSGTGTSTHFERPDRGAGGGNSGIRFGLNARQREEAAAIRKAEEMEEELIGYLDGTHHSDEIQVRFGMSWSKLQGILGLDEVKEGMGKKGISLIYR
ncbi:uncharacterized protein I303_100933 [Kwoniella dejecticola CBS 10117]|uniref:Nitrogen permease regulator 2 n=1 Tax=Kwoniella dejecticola CBS 10117 TaxID=1296121 RepID=A0A1A6AGA9_9TREE|nr:nitrogen permease regulator 2 [Kwoniella dejecticola CBS 10117]OBR89115.1 nitrogen permease regulator 2 [Kwoniella dejecticola CBS 10117]